MLRRLQAVSAQIRSTFKRPSSVRKLRAGSPERTPQLPKRWHAVCVDAKPLSCAVAQELRGRRFLSSEAPSLPLKDCSNRANCPCTYRHHEDRRGKQRRRGPESFTSTQKVPTRERREAKGRRSED